MQSEPPVALQTTYDSADAGLQFRCNLHYMMKPQVFIALAVLAAVPTVALRLPFTYFFGIFAAFLAFCFAEVFISSKRRAAKPRICTTTINEHGVHDLTPDGGVTNHWHEITRIETKNNGDIFFFTNSGGLFVPSTAFTDFAKSQEYYLLAMKLWLSNRTQIAPTKPKLSPAEIQVSKDKQIADILAEEDAVWEALEKEHAKQKEKGETVD